MTETAQCVRASGRDAAAIQAMVHAAYSLYIERIGRPPAPMQTDYGALVDEAVRNGEGRGLEIWVLRVDAASPAVVGSVILEPASDDAGALKVNNLVVDPVVQGRGYGRRLMGFAEERARALGRPRLVLFTNVMMWENVALYGKWGFVETGRRREDGYERVYFRKELATEA